MPQTNCHYLKQHTEMTYLHLVII